MSDLTLITFLGRAPRGQGGYRKTRYDFGDGAAAPELAFFGWALQRRLQPRRLVVLGTSGSMWDHLFEGDLDLGAADTEARLELVEAVDAQSVTQDRLERLAPALGAHLGCEVRLGLIPYCRDESEQTALLVKMADHVDEGGRVHLDVTHGFRHLPMLALLSALHLRFAKRADIAAIWYGAYDPDTGKAPVHDLSGLLKIAEGMQALAGFDHSGDYAIFAPILSHSGLPADAFAALNKAAYYENILNVGAATGELRKLMSALDTLPPGTETALLLPLIRQRLEWLDESKQFEKQTHLARSALQRRDYLRAVLYAYEAVITRLCQIEHVPIDDFVRREEVRARYEKRIRANAGEERENYRLLKNLRNQVAHGTRGSVQAVQQALLSEDVMHAQLQRLLGEIAAGRLPGQPPP